MKFKEVKVINQDFHSDYRGDLWTLWKKDKTFSEIEFNHDKVSTSRKNVLRGIHGDNKSTKLITCLHGEVYFVVVDNRPESETFLQWDWTILSESNKKMVLVPPRFGNAFFTLSETSVFYYKWSYVGEYPDVSDQFTLKWNDSRIGIDWPIENPILQLRDR